MSFCACAGGCAAQTSAPGGNLKKAQTNGPAAEVREEGALELAESKSMKPYMSLTIAMIQGRDVAKALREIASLPLVLGERCRSQASASCIGVTQWNSCRQSKFGLNIIVVPDAVRDQNTSSRTRGIDRARCVREGRRAVRADPS